MNRIAAYLIEKETITGKEFMDILNQVKSAQDQDMDAAKGEAERRHQSVGNHTETAETLRKAGDSDKDSAGSMRQADAVQKIDASQDTF